VIVFHGQKRKRCFFSGEFENRRKENLIFCMGAPPILSLWTPPFEGFSEIMIFCCLFQRSSEGVRCAVRSFLAWNLVGDGMGSFVWRGKLTFGIFRTILGAVLDESGGT
jgi:hypothetical protein